jgi:hypothetical protein
MPIRFYVDYETENEWVWNVNIKWEKELCIWIVYVYGENKNWILYFMCNCESLYVSINICVEMIN